MERIIRRREHSHVFQRIDCGYEIGLREGARECSECGVYGIDGYAGGNGQHGVDDVDDAAGEYCMISAVVTVSEKTPMDLPERILIATWAPVTLE